MREKKETTSEQLEARLATHAVVEARALGFGGFRASEFRVWRI